MTTLIKPISRRATLLTDNRHTARARDQYTVTLYPDGTIGFRAVRCRTEERIELAACYRLAVRNRVIREKAEKAKLKKERGK
jgi:hypothetical protein